MQFTVEDKRLVKWLWLSKNYGQKCFLEIFLTEDEVLLGSRWSCKLSRFISKTVQDISALLYPLLHYQQETDQ